MNKVIIIGFCINLFFVIIFALSCRKKRQKIGLSLLFLSLPFFGFVIYFISKFVMRMCHEFSYDRDNLVKRHTIQGLQTAPNVAKELDLISIEDAMAVSSKKEKRELLLTQLKKDLYENYRSILPASTDTDSESAHYVAAAKMQVRQQMHGEIIEMQKQIQELTVESNVWKEYLFKLEKYIESGLLEQKESIIYKEEFCLYFEKLQQLETCSLEKTECTNYLCYTIDLGRIEKAESFWTKCSDEQKEEVSYRKMLELYYNQRNKDKFYEYIQQLEKSDIKLSSDCLAMLRFWNRRS
jgi:hypothetical protein